jgi:hypothetical protein
MAAQVLLTLKSPMWWAMKLARGLKMVRSLPRSLHQAQLVAFDALAQLVVADLQVGHLGHGAGSLMPAICWLRQFSSALGAVV